MENTEEIIKKALELKNDQEFEESIKILEGLFKKNPDSEEIKKNYLDVLFAYGGYLNDDYHQEYEKSIEFFKRIIEIEPNNYRVLYNLGISYFNLGRMQNAIKACTEAVNLKPDYKHCWYNMGLIYETIEEWKKALEYYDKALEIDPDFEYAVQAKHHINQMIERKSIVLEPEPEKNIDLDQLKALLKISKRLRIQMIQDLLNVDDKKLLEILIEWGEKYQFEIDGDFVNINKETLPNLLNALDKNKIL